MNTDFEKKLMNALSVATSETKTKNGPLMYFVSLLREWINNKGRPMSFTFPMIWREPTEHLPDFYFCIVPPLRHGITKKTQLP